MTITSSYIIVGAAVPRPFSCQEAVLLPSTPSQRSQHLLNPLPLPGEKGACLGPAQPLLPGFIAQLHPYSCPRPSAPTTAVIITPHSNQVRAPIWLDWSLP